MTRPSKILIVGPAWIGDMVMAHSLLQWLKQRHPGVTLDVLAPSWTFSLLKCMPEVSKAIPMPISHGELKLWERLMIAKQLRGYDQAIVLPNSFKSALIPWFAKIKQRTGWLGEKRYYLLNDYRKLNKIKLPLMVEQYLALGLAPGEPIPDNYPLPRFHVDEASRYQALNKFLLTPPTRPVLGLGVGAAFGSSKRWPEAYFAEVAAHVQEKGWAVWLFGSAADNKITSHIQKNLRETCIDFSGLTTLDETIHLLSYTTGVISNDSGLMHMAGALQKPLIALYGSSSPSYTPPLSPHAQILRLELPCQPCFQRECPLKHHHCMKNLLPSRVIAALDAWKIKP